MTIMSLLKSKFSPAYFFVPFCLFAAHFSAIAGDLDVGAGLNVGPLDASAGVGIGTSGIGIGAGAGIDQGGYVYPQGAYYNDYNDNGYYYQQGYPEYGYYSNSRNWQGYDDRRYDRGYEQRYDQGYNQGYNRGYDRGYDQNGRYRNDVGAGAHIRAR